MNDLRPSFEREAGQVTLQGLPASAAGEALLTPVPGLDLAFDRVDGHLCRAVVDVAGQAGPSPSTSGRPRCSAGCSARKHATWCSEPRSRADASGGQRPCSIPNRSWR